MKVQDIVFLIVLGVLLLVRKPRVAVGAGVAAILLSMPLFYAKIALFTAQRLVMYASAFFLITIIFHLYTVHSTKKLS